LLMVSATVPVSVPGLTCSFVNLCNGPNPTNTCVGDHGAIINPAKLNCGLAVAERSWAEVKSLFR
jgi:hypothetical protein